MNTVTLKLELWSRKVNQSKVLSMITISETFKVISKKTVGNIAQTKSGPDGRERMRMDADTHLGDGKPQ